MVSCVTANVCYYFECYSIIIYVMLINSINDMATALSNVRPIPDMPTFSLYSHDHRPTNIS